MRCPSCNRLETRVVDTRVVEDGSGIRRRRECEKCSHRFSTNEQLELLDMIVIKRDGRRVQYSRDSLIKGVKRSLEKRPYSSDDIAKLVCNVERDIQKKFAKEVSSENIGHIVMKYLKSLDKVAYMRFASVYLNFEDADTFIETASKLVRKKK